MYDYSAGQMKANSGLFPNPNAQNGGATADASASQGASATVPPWMQGGFRPQGGFGMGMPPWMQNGGQGGPQNFWQRMQQMRQKFPGASGGATPAPAPLTQPTAAAPPPSPVAGAPVSMPMNPTPPMTGTMVDPTQTPDQSPVSFINKGSYTGTMTPQPGFGMPNNGQAPWAAGYAQPALSNLLKQL